MPEEVSLTLPSPTPLSRSLSKTVPNSATKPGPPAKPQVTHRAEDDISVQTLSHVDDQCLGHSKDASPVTSNDPTNPKSTIERLPSEILEVIIGHVLGHLGSTKLGGYKIRNWNEIMRHPRSKHFSVLALVSSQWRKLVQERIFRHIIVYGRREDIVGCGDFFLTHTHLQHYVRHFQVRVPIWEPKKGQQPTSRHTLDSATSGANAVWRTFQAVPFMGENFFGEQQQDVLQLFQQASKNATVSEIFGCAQAHFTHLYALTIESTQCKRPPQILYFRPKDPGASTPTPLGSYPASPRPSMLPISEYETQNLPVLPTAKALILRGAWNFARTDRDFNTLKVALPNLQEFHSSYNVPKTKAYRNICHFLRPGSLPRTITNLNIGLENLIARPADSLSKWQKLYPAYHICVDIGKILPQLESLTYSGRLCSSLFHVAKMMADIAAMPSNPENPFRMKDIETGNAAHYNCTRLQHIDILATNTCKHGAALNDSAGTHSWQFIQAFEALILSFVRILGLYPNVTNARIRFVDLDTQALKLNPAFHLEGDRAWGFWSDEILLALGAARPGVVFEGVVREGVEVWDAGRSVGVEYYKAMAEGLLREPL